MRINRMSTRRHLPKREHSWPPTELEQTPTIVVSSHAPTPSPTHTHSVDALREKFNSPTRIPEPTVEQLRQQLRPKEQSRAPQPKQLKQSEEEQVTPKTKGFSAPETKAADADIGLVAPKCEYYEQLTHRRAATPTLPASQPYRPRLKRQSYSLERGRSRKRVVTAASTDLPPPKPRSANGTPKLQRRCIKLATELKICYDGDSEEEKQHKVDIDLEAMPLPAVPSDKQRTGTAAAVRESLPSEASAVIDSLAAKQQQQLALVLAMTTPAEQSQLQSQSETRIIPISISSTEEQPLQATAQRIYSEACDYLRQEHTMPEEATPTYISATSGIKLQRQDSNKPKPCNSSCIPTPPPLPPPPTPPAQLRARAKGSAEQDQAKQTRRQGGIYEQHEAHVEIAQLEAKYAHIQQSIAEHLRQIDSYMENAKQALQRSVQATPTPTPPTAAPVAEVETVQPRPELWDMFAARQSPILAVESPLQAILRQIYCRAAGIQQLPKNQLGEESTVPEAKPEENVPIVERALQDLHKIAEALDNEEQKQELLQLEHKQTPTAGEAQTVLIDEEEEEEEEKQAEEPDYKHVSDVIANYEQLAKSDTASSCTHEQLEHTEAGSAGAGAGAGSWCAICGECRDSPHGWGKINQADQWRFNNLQNELLTNYKATYEIRSPYVSRQISWEDAQQQQQQPKPEAEPKPQPQLQPKTETEPKPQPQPQLWRQRSEVQIITAPSSSSLEPEPVQWVRSRSPSPLPARKYPAPLIETAQRCSSPFGLNAVQSAATPTPTPTTLEAKYTHVPQLGQNTGLLVHTATQPLQLCLSSSSTLLAATPPATPRCNSQPPPFDFLLQHGQAPFKSLAASEDGELTQSTRDFSVNRSFDNVSPRPYIGIEGYKRVAWPPASEERIVREFTPQPQTQSPAPGAGGYYAQPATAPAATSAAPAQQQQYRAPSHDHYNQQQHQQPHQQHWQQPHQQQQQAHHQHQQQSPYQTSSGYQQQPHYAQQNGGAQYNAQPQYNSYSQPQQHQQQHHLHYSQDQTDLQHDYRGASPGIITLRKEAPVSQTPAPVYASQPAAVNYRGGSTSRGDMKWPPQEYKEAAAKENEERRQLALGPVCRPRRVNRQDYTGFFAKHQLNNTYPSYKVPPGTQHMFA
ncbi:uncharacterized protein LOC108599974 isoform X2 [Drosophila busckii]|uniref:uncharacterized protein LOC108599974 isoform X2 n=1 Tax=Drosophila busckii TaxID=30019 RepID=UPI0014333028|nr:uncharacterized protein LOC108599974 isoform X2 [Drosophila busckii]